MLIFKIVPRALWAEAEAGGVFRGAPVDLADGYIHFSTAAQVRETARRHFGGQPDLLIAAFESEALGPALRWEASRGGDLFPHLYASLRTVDAVQVEPLPLGPDGAHLFPNAIP